MAASCEHECVSIDGDSLTAEFSATQKVHRSMEPPNFINPLKPELNPICYLLALLAHHFLHVSRIRVKKFLTVLHVTSSDILENEFSQSIGL